MCTESVLSHAETLLNMLVYSPHCPFIETQPLLAMLQVGVSLKSRVSEVLCVQGLQFQALPLPQCSSWVWGNSLLPL